MMIKKLSILFLATLLFLTTIGFSSDNVLAATSEIPEITTTPEISGVNPLGNAGVCDYSMTGWKYHSTIKRNVKVEKLLGAGTSIIVSILLPWDKAKAAVQIANSAHLILRDNVYITQTNYRMFARTGKYLDPIAGEKTITRFYSNSARTKLLDTKTHYKYTKWYCK